MKLILAKLYRNKAAGPVDIFKKMLRVLDIFPIDKIKEIINEIFYSADIAEYLW